MSDDDYSRHVDLTVASSSESDGHPADEMIVSKAAKRAAAQQHAVTMPDADAGAAAEEQAGQPKKYRRKKKKTSPDTAAVDGAAAAQPAHAEPSAGGSLQSSAAGAAGNAAAAAATAKPRKAGAAAAMLSPSNAQQLRQQPALPVGAAPAAEPPPGLELEPAVRPDPPDAAVPRTPAPLGVIVVDDEEDVAPNSEMQRFLRPPRYFDVGDNFEAAAMRCYRCGGSGHKAQDCTNEAKARPCALCAQFGHTKANCPSLVCFKCNRSGHMAKDCTYSYNSRVTDAGSAVCLRCGSASCRGVEDWVRAEGGCTMRYSPADLALAVCYVCGRRGHLCCASAPASTYRPSCYNCGDGGHTAPDCRREKPIAVRKERDASYSAAAAPSYYDDGYGDYGGAWGFGGGGGGGGGYGGGGGGGGMTCYACGGEGHMARDCPNKYSNDRGGSRSTSRSLAPCNTTGHARTQQPSWQHDRR